MRVAAVIGNPRLGSRTSKVAMAVATTIASRLSGDVTDVVELADIADLVHDQADLHVQRLNASIAASDVVVVASPTYKASYTGLLKSFLDRYDYRGLSSVVAIPVMTGAVPQHALAADVHLRPVLVELGASVPTSSLFFLADQLPELDRLVAGWAELNSSVLARLVRGFDRERDPGTSQSRSAPKKSAADE